MTMLLTTPISRRLTGADAQQCDDRANVPSQTSPSDQPPYLVFVLKAAATGKQLRLLAAMG